jgi:hypothetical protein
MNELDKAYNPQQARDARGRFTYSGATRAGEFLTSTGETLTSTGETLTQLGEIAHSVKPKTPFWRTTGDLVLNIGGSAYALGHVAKSSRSLYHAQTKGAMLKHATIIAVSVAALAAHLKSFPEEAKDWWKQVHPALARLRTNMIELKHRIFAERNRSSVNKMARGITAMMEQRVAV